MKRLAALLLLAAAPSGAAQAQAPEAEGLEARPAAWTMEMREGQPVLRGATLEDPGDRIIFLCNDDRRLIAMLFLLSDDPGTVAAHGSGSGRWVIDGRFQEGVDARPVMPIGRHVLSTAFVDPPLVRRLIAADAAGFAWDHSGGPPFAGFQIRMAGGREQLAAFAHACNAEVYR